MTCKGCYDIKIILTILTTNTIYKYYFQLCFVLVTNFSMVV